MNQNINRTVLLAALVLAFASAMMLAQSTGSAPDPASTSTAQPAPGTTPVGGDSSAPADTKQTSQTPSAQPAPQSSDSTADTGEKGKKDKKDKKKPGTDPVEGDSAGKVDPEKVVPVGGDLQKVKTGSIEDVNAVGNRDIGGRGLGNWYSTDTEIKMGKSYADEIEKSSKFITDSVVDEYVNRVGQNIVKNSDCKVPFTIKVIDSDEINAFALPGG